MRRVSFHSHHPSVYSPLEKKLLACLALIAVAMALLLVSR